MIAYASPLGQRSYIRYIISGWDKALPTNCGDPEHPTTRIQREPIKFDRRASILFVSITRSAATQYHRLSQILQYIELVQHHVNINRFICIVMEFIFYRIRSLDRRIPRTVSLQTLAASSIPVPSCADRVPAMS